MLGPHSGPHSAKRIFCRVIEPKDTKDGRSSKNTTRNFGLKQSTMPANRWAFPKATMLRSRWTSRKPLATAAKTIWYVYLSSRFTLFLISHSRQLKPKTEAVYKHTLNVAGRSIRTRESFSARHQIYTAEYEGVPPPLDPQGHPIAKNERLPDVNR